MSENQLSRGIIVSTLLASAVMRFSDQLDSLDCSACGKCRTVKCPGRIANIPQLVQAVSFKDLQQFLNLAGLRCVACGRCRQVCPANLPLNEIFSAFAQASVEMILQGKAGSEVRPLKLLSRGLVGPDYIELIGSAVGISGRLQE